MYKDDDNNQVYLSQQKKKQKTVKIQCKAGFILNIFMIAYYVSVNVLIYLCKFINICDVKNI